MGLQDEQTASPGPIQWHRTIGQSRTRAQRSLWRVGLERQHHYEQLE